MPPDQKYFFVLINKLDGKNFRRYHKTEEKNANEKSFEFLEFNSLEFCLSDLNKDVKIDFYNFEQNTSEKSNAFGIIEKKYNDLINNINEIPIYSIEDQK